MSPLFFFFLSFFPHSPPSLLPLLTHNSGMTLTIPAKLHPEVVLHAVAARDRKRAEEFAQKNGIPVVRDTYQGIFLASLFLWPNNF